MENPHLDSTTPLEQAKAILGEHYENYVVMVVHPDGKDMEWDYDNPYAARGMCLSLNATLECLDGTEESDYEDMWKEDEDKEEF